MSEGEGSGEPQEQALAVADSKEIRRLSHDMNNALELIVQASYLVSTTELSDSAKDWMKLLDQGVRQVADLNKQLRDFILKRS